MLYSDGAALVVTDGTVAGTVSLPTGVPGSFVAIGGRIFVKSAGPGDGTGGPILSVSDGSRAGTVALAVPGLVSILGKLTVVGNDIVFTGMKRNGHAALFETDGTVAGSRELTLPAGVIVGAGTVIGDLVAPVTLGGGDQTYAAPPGDLLTASTGRESVLGGGGNTTIDDGTASSRLFAGNGPTTVNGGSGGDTIVGGSGPIGVNARNGDAIFGNGGALSVTGSGSGAGSGIGGAGPFDVKGRGAKMLVVTGSSVLTVSTGKGAALVFARSGNNIIARGHRLVAGGVGFESRRRVRGCRQRVIRSGRRRRGRRRRAAWVQDRR